MAGKRSIGIMALILNIDTALDIATVSLAENGKLIRSLVNEEQKDHAAWLHPAIKKITVDAGTGLEQLNAIGVNNGPGSYTGLRVGLSAAKGLCYALTIPLVTVGSLHALALGAKNEQTDLICPMIDARRMEVFTALYDKNLTEIIKPHPIILEEHSFDEFLKGYKILFLGNGSVKFKKILSDHPHAIFKNLPLKPQAIATVTYENFIGNNFVDLAYTEPFYLKEFYVVQLKND